MAGAAITRGSAADLRSLRRRARSTPCSVSYPMTAMRRKRRLDLSEYVRLSDAMRSLESFLDDVYNRNRTPSTPG